MLRGIPLSGGARDTWVEVLRTSSVRTTDTRIQFRTFIIDAWVAGKMRVPVLIPPSMPLLEPDPAFEQGAIAAA